MPAAPLDEQKFFGSFFQKRTDFFFEKKKQKTFARLEPTLGQIPLVVAVSGHRFLDPAAWESLEAAVGRVLDELAAAHPDMPLLMLNALADGADRMAARVALAAGVRLHAVLPMTRDEYRRDFDAESAAEYDAILDDPRVEWFELPHLGSRQGDAAQALLSRVLQYEQLAVFLAQNSHVLLAIWNGQEGGEPGGTSQVVALKRADRNAQHYDRRIRIGRFEHPLDMAEPGPVHHIGAANCKAGNDRAVQGVVAGGHRVLWPEGADHRRRYDAACAQIAAFNIEVRRLPAAARAQVARCMHGLLPDAVADAAPIGIRRLRAAFGASDYLAQKFQTRSRLVLRLFAFLALAVIASQAFVTDDVWSSEALAIYFGAILSAWMLHWLASARAWQTKFQDYRALAEALRVQFFWALADSAEQVTDSYLRNHADALAWIRFALDGIVSGTRDHVRLYRMDDPLDPVAAERLRLYWFERQSAYFSRQIQRTQSVVRVVHVLAYVSLGVAAAVALLLIGEHARPGLLAQPWRRLAPQVMALAPGIAAAVLYLIEKNALEPQVARYRHALATFGRTRGAVLTYRVIHDLGRDALAENAEWLMLHRDRVIKPLT